MKVIILGTAYPYRGGLAAFNERLARQFISEGHEVKIVTFTLQYPSFIFPGKTQYSDSPAPADLHIERRMNSVNPLSWIKTGRLIARERPDILVIKFWIPYMAPCLGTIAGWVKRNKHTRIVSVLDNIIPHESHMVDKWLTRYFVNSADRFVAMSDSVLNDLSLFDSTKPRTLCMHPLYDNFGVIKDKQQARIKLNLPADKTIFLFFGFIRDYKGLDLLLEAFADKRIDKDKAILVVAGEFYNNRERYIQLEKQLDLAGSIRWFSDFIPDEEVGTFFSASDLVVQPYKTATQSGVTQIAYHFNKPMLVTDVGGLAEIVPHNKVGYVVKPHPSAIAEALLDFLTGDKTTCFEKNISEEKKKYAWSNMTKAIIGE